MWLLLEMLEFPSLEAFFDCLLDGFGNHVFVMMPILSSNASFGVVTWLASDRSDVGKDEENGDDGADLLQESNLHVDFFVRNLRAWTRKKHEFEIGHDFATVRAKVLVHRR